ncbi:MAG: hypothetical protein ABEL76_03445 [Bradymonadaceae bacterium]
MATDPQPEQPDLEADRADDEGDERQTDHERLEDEDRSDAPQSDFQRVADEIGRRFRGALDRLA